jgi:hypothetical protein
MRPKQAALQIAHVAQQISQLSPDPNGIPAILCVHGYTYNLRIN